LSADRETSVKKKISGFLSITPEDIDYVDTTCISTKRSNGEEKMMGSMKVF